MIRRPDGVRAVLIGACALCLAIPCTLRVAEAEPRPPAQAPLEASRASSAALSVEAPRRSTDELVDELTDALSLDAEQRVSVRAIVEAARVALLELDAVVEVDRTMRSRLDRDRQRVLWDAEARVEALLDPAQRDAFRQRARMRAEARLERRRPGARIGGNGARGPRGPHRGLAEQGAARPPHASPEAQRGTQ